MDALSPSIDTFSTPPTSPRPTMDSYEQPAIARKISRPTSINVDINQTEWNPNVIVEHSPGIARNVPTHVEAPPPNRISQEKITANSTQEFHNHSQMPLNSPCFVHSHLDKGASLTDWLRTKQKQHNVIGETEVGVAKSLQHISDNHTHHALSTAAIGDNDDDDDFGGSLTKQLAETAVGVREMSKQLGRARVRTNIQSVLIITKARDNRLIKLTKELALYLMLKPRTGQARGLIVYVDNQLRKSKRFDAEGIERDHPELFVPFPRRRTSSTNSVSSMSSWHSHKEEPLLRDEGQLRYWTSSLCSHSPHLFDLVITLGGDGTVLFTSWLFQRIVPPVLSFALGSLGFLTNFDFADHQSVADSVIDSGIRVNLRMRFTCTVYRAVTVEESKGRKAVKKGETGEIMMRNVEKGGWEALEGGWTGNHLDGKCNAKDKEIMCFTTRPAETFEVLNDLVVDRGPSPYVSLLELFGDEHHMTTVQADGLTVSTPTGSTAYSLSAGGSLVHPEIPALLITPICPHTLSFRPMLLPDSMELRICVPYNSRSTAWASFDGRGRVELKQGDHIKVTASKYPFPTVCADKQSTDWFHAISRTLKWNERERQKSFVFVEEGPAKHKKKHSGPSPEPVVIRSDSVIENEEEESDESSEDEDEDTFDITDSSPEADSLKADARPSKRDEAVGGASTKESLGTERPRRNTISAKKDRSRTSKSRSRSRPRLNRFGVDSPSRFAPPRSVSPRRVEFATNTSSPTSSPDPPPSPTDAARQGARDDIYSLHQASSRNRIPKERETELDNVKTPTASFAGVGRPRGHSRASSDHRRAFAVWGHDESDSNASDSDA